MEFLLNTAAFFAMLCTAFATLCAITFCMGMGANAKPHEIRALKFWMLGLTLLGASGITAGIFLLRAGQPGWSACASVAPAIIMALILAVALLK